ncbi:hypothetical protein [Marinilabilia rubra]|uniref:PAS domain-containing protein n=1 Tax=Marinilabilia rubra TaxID=2162893 RepID=A0A2U2B5I1_9BACT|nr:hypothetical protein [Marinilabilia rubra]PWD98294.1 hypothetical protein DDZ16_16070 [Marinilabilia rubra]
MTSDETDFRDSGKLREKAEEQLKKNQKTAYALSIEADAGKLLHELQVHQIELEMQNEELQQAYETAEKALRKYTMLFDLSPMGYFSLNPDGVICDLNFTGADMLNERRFSLVNSNFKLFITEDSKTVFTDFFKRVYTSNAKESCQVMLGYDNKSLCRVYMEGVVTEDEQNCLLSVVDISKFSRD